MKRHSLHIGIDRYDDAQIKNLPYCTADADLLDSFFRDVAGYDSVARLSDPSRGAILDAVAEETARLSPGDLLVMTYSGHGMRLRDGWGILASDSRLELASAGVDGLPLKILRERARKAGVNLAVFLDSCPAEFAGTRGIFFALASSEQAQRDLVPVGEGAHDGPSFSAMWPETTLEISALGHGLFTAALDRALRELHAKGACAISDELRARTVEHMKAICAENGGSSSPCVNFFTSAGAIVNLW